jgi:hypothetical protein
MSVGLCQLPFHGPNFRKLICKLSIEAKDAGIPIFDTKSYRDRREGFKSETLQRARGPVKDCGVS